MGRREAIPRHMSIGEVRVKIAYAGQQQVCDLCDAPGQIAQNCPYRNKCFQCGLKGHFSRNCPQLVSYRDRVSVLDELDPTPAEAAGRAVAAAAAALDADIDLSDSKLTTSVGPTPSSTLDSHDNQLDELVSQSLLSSPAPSGAGVDSLQGANIESAVFDSPASPSSPGQGPPSSASSVGLLGKIKQRVG